MFRVQQTGYPYGKAQQRTPPRRLMLTQRNTGIRGPLSGAGPGVPAGVEIAPDLDVELTRREDAPALARSLVSSWCDGWGIEPSRRETVRLLVSELVTNAVLHPQAPADATIKLAASHAGRHVLVSVADTGTGRAPAQREPAPTEGGYGLYLVERQSRRWGVGRGEGTRVWFEV